MNFGQAIQAGFRNYVAFTGRASRAEYWYWFLFVSLVRVALSFLDGGNRATPMNLDVNPNGVVTSTLAAMALPALWNLATFLPTLGVTVRRLRDAGCNPKVLLWGLAPLVLAIVTLFVAVAAIFAPGPAVSEPAIYNDLGRFAPVLLVGGLTMAASLGIGIWFIVMLAKPSKAADNPEVRPYGVGE